MNEAKSGILSYSEQMCEDMQNDQICGSRASARSIR